MHVFRDSVPRYECDYSPVPEGCQHISGFFHRFPEYTFFGTFVLLKMAAYSDPFIFIYIILFYCSVEHQVFSILLYITQCA